ncbi:hypothetical protein SAMN06265219_105108 [Gracilimonas mengyeensis]|uniref:Uncharacterized protein n=1 Tax=Gracilimonas mengyeensis TaxID=1302730 RepID=A0A521CFI8_9BACT|nr:hypothetical protein SAMN06265219_105108 [Gracilimonas mengyeensis]
MLAFNLLSKLAVDIFHGGPYRNVIADCYTLFKEIQGIFRIGNQRYLPA